MANTTQRKSDPLQPSNDRLLADMVITRLSALESGQNTMNSVLGLMLDTLQAQTNLLRQINEYAKDEPGESPLTKILRELTSAIMELDASVGGMETKFERLSGVIADAYGMNTNGKTSVPVKGDTQ
jgi:hypothetical protein